MSAGAISGASNSVAAATGTGFGDLTSAEFVKIMMSELTNQDPFEPQDSGAMLEQLSSLRNIESQMNLQNQLGSLVSQNQLGASAGMIGKVVSGLGADGRMVEGEVTQVKVVKGKPVLQLDTGRTIDFGNVTTMTNKSRDDINGSDVDLSKLDPFEGDFNGDHSVDYLDRQYISAGKNLPEVPVGGDEPSADQILAYKEADLAVVEANYGKYHEEAISMDMNQDGKVDVLDRNRLVAYLTQGQESGLGDLNKDKQLNTSDLNLWEQRYDQLIGQ